MINNDFAKNQLEVFIVVALKSLTMFLDALRSVLLIMAMSPALEKKPPACPF